MKNIIAVIALAVVGTFQSIAFAEEGFRPGTLECWVPAELLMIQVATNGENGPEYDVSEGTAPFSYRVEVKIPEQFGYHRVLDRPTSLSFEGELETSVEIWKGDELQLALDARHFGLELAGDDVLFLGARIENDNSLLKIREISMILTDDDVLHNLRHPYWVEPSVDNASGRIYQTMQPAGVPCTRQR